MQTKSVTHRQVLSFLWSYVRRYTFLLTIMVCLLLLSTALGLVQPLFYKEMVDAIAGGSGSDPSVLRRTMTMLIGGILCGVGTVSCFEGAAYLLGTVEAQVMRDAHCDVFARVQRLSTRFHVNAFAGATARKIGRGTDAIEHMLDTIWFNFFPLLASIVGFLIVLSFFAPLMGVAIVLSMAIYTPLAIWQNLYLMRFTQWTDRQDTRVTASLVDAITGNPAVKAFSAHAREEERHGGVIGEWKKRAVKTWHTSTLTAWCQSMLMLLIEFALFVIAVFLWYRGVARARS